MEILLYNATKRESLEIQDLTIGGGGTGMRAIQYITIQGGGGGDEGIIRSIQQITFVVLLVPLPVF